MNKKMMIAIPLALLLGLALLLLQKPAVKPGKTGETTAVASSAGSVKVEPAPQNLPEASEVKAPRTVARNILTIPRHEADIIRLASRFKAPLTKAEIDACQKLYTGIFERRQAIELRVAQKKEISKDQVEIEIPPYAEGDKLEAEMMEGFQRILGKAKADQFLTEARFAISDLNHNWGREIQLIKVDYKAVDNYYHISHATFLAHDPRWGEPLIVSESFLRSSNLSKYTYLKPLFPHQP